MTREEAVRQGDRMRRFLDDDAVVSTFTALEERYYEQFKSGADATALLQAQARTRALDDLRKELRDVVRKGEDAAAELKHERDRRP